MKTMYDSPSVKVISVQPVQCFAISPSNSMPGVWDRAFMDGEFNPEFLNQ